MKLKPVECLIFEGKLPDANAMAAMWGWRVKKDLKAKAIRIFGKLPVCAYPQQFAHVRITRVLGKRERPLDRDNLAMVTKPLVDAAVICGYLIDDKEKYADITYHQDSTRRMIGPRIELEITYEE